MCLVTGRFAILVILGFKQFRWEVYQQPGQYMNNEMFTGYRMPRIEKFVSVSVVPTAPGLFSTGVFFFFFYY